MSILIEQVRLGGGCGWERFGRGSPGRLTDRWTWGLGAPLAHGHNKTGEDPHTRPSAPVPFTSSHSLSPEKTTIHTARGPESWILCASLSS